MAEQQKVFVDVDTQRDFLDVAGALLPEEPWDGDTWAQWTAALKTRTSRKGKALFHPLRLALTGREEGPELAALLPLIGRINSEARLSARDASAHPAP